MNQVFSRLLFSLSVGIVSFSCSSPALLIEKTGTRNRVLVTDIDDTIFNRARAEAMKESASVLARLDGENYRVVYVTARPDLPFPFLNFTRSEAAEFLRENHYPAGPLFTGDLKNVLPGCQHGSKIENLEKYVQYYGDLTVGVGDKYTDYIAYRSFGIPAFIIFDCQNDPDEKKFEGSGRPVVNENRAAWSVIYDRIKAGNFDPDLTLVRDCPAK